MTFKVNAVLGMRGFYSGIEGLLPAQVTKVHNESLVDIVVFGGFTLVAAAHNVSVYEYATQGGFSYKPESAPLKIQTGINSSGDAKVVSTSVGNSPTPNGQEICQAQTN